MQSKQYMDCFAVLAEQLAEPAMKFNTTTSVAMRIGSRYNAPCVPRVLSGGQLKQVSELKCMGVYLEAANILF